MQVFERCVGEGVVVCGGGCADTVAAGYLREKVMKYTLIDVASE